MRSSKRRDRYSSVQLGFVGEGFVTGCDESESGSRLADVCLAGVVTGIVGFCIVIAGRQRVVEYAGGDHIARSLGN